MRSKRKMLGLTATASLLSLAAVLSSCGGGTKEFTVTFKNGTETVTTQKVKDGYNVSVPEELKDNVDFNGWYSDSSLTTPFDFGSVVNKDITIYANFINKYTVTFESNGGSAVSAKTVREGANVEMPTAPTKEGFNFGGWYSDSALTNAFDFGSVITKNLTLYAKWEEENQVVETVSVVLNYNFNDYSVTESATKGAAYTPTAPNREGFTFAGWFTDEALTKAYVNGTKLNSNLVLYAKWNAPAGLTTYGFGEGLISWGDVETTVGTKEYNNNGTIQMVLANSYSKDGITLVSNGKNRINHDSEGNVTGYITQQAEITFVVKSNATISVEGIWGPTKKTGKVYLKKDGTAVYTSSSYSANSNADVSFTKEVEAGTYTLTSDATISITKISVSRTIEYVNVSYNSEHSNIPNDTIVEKNDKLTALPEMSADGWIFEGWYTTATFDEGTKFDLSSVVTTNTTLYAKWKVYNPADYATVTYNFGVSNQTELPTVVEKGQKLTALPAVQTVEGYRFVRWYKEDNSTFDVNTPITGSMTIYVEFIQQRTVTFKYEDGTVVDTLVVDDDTKISSAYIPTAKYNYGKKFVGWYNGTQQFDFTTSTITQNLNLVAKYETQEVANNVTFISSASYNEGLYAEFLKYDEATVYNCYVKKATEADSAYKKLDDPLVRLYKAADNSYQYYRVDALGLAAGDYKLKVVPVINNEEVAAAASVTDNLSVVAHDRSGFAFVNGTSSGAYNEDGTLRTNAVVLYITEDTKNTISLDVVKDSKGNTENAVGLQNILNIYKKGMDKRPLDVRFIGQITDLAVMEGGDLVISGSGSDQAKRVSCGITFEGVGNDATFDGFGLRIKNASNVEVRNIGFMNCDSSEGDDCGLQQDNDHVWVHNCDFFYGGPGGDADQAKGDGALDAKTSTYITNSYNHFFDCGKCNLLGLSEKSTTGYYATYHHNWYDHSDSRHPRARYYTIHIYNNYYDGNSKYGVGVTLGASAFVENNYFRGCKYPMLSSMQGSDVYAEGTVYNKNYGTFSDEDGGSIKSFGNVMAGTYTYIPYGSSSYVLKGNQTAYDKSGTNSTIHFDAYEATSRDEQVPNIVKSYQGNNTYNNFDTASTMYQYQVETAEQAKDTVVRWSGRVQGGDFKWKFSEADDADYNVNQALKTAITNYKTNLISVQGVEGNGGSGTDTPTPTPTEKTAADVVALIDALPESTAVTAANKTAIEAAKAAFDALSSEEQVKVTNKAKLEACISKLKEVLNSGSHIKTFNDGVADASGYFTIKGNLKDSVPEKTYNGVKYTTAMKMESESKTSISFTCTGTVTLTIITDTASKKIKIDGTASTTDANGVVTIQLAAGTHTIIKGDSINVYAFIVE